MPGEADAFLLLIIACLFPPAAVALVTGCSADLCLNILLTMLGYLPGCIHAFWLVLKRIEANERFGQNNWIYTGMGGYQPRGQAPLSARYSASYGQGQAPPPPAAGQYPAGKNPLPDQPPIDQRPPADQKSGGVEPPAPADQKYQVPPPEREVQAVPQVPADQTPAVSTAQTTTAQTSGT